MKLHYGCITKVPLTTEALQIQELKKSQKHKHYKKT